MNSCFLSVAVCCSGWGTFHLHQNLTSFRHLSDLRVSIQILTLLPNIMVGSAWAHCIDLVGNFRSSSWPSRSAQTGSFLAAVHPHQNLSATCGRNDYIDRA